MAGMPDFDAFVPGPRCHVDGAASGALAGLTFAVKDLIDVAGIPTGAGNPDWARGRKLPQRHAWVRQVLCAAALPARLPTRLIVAQDAFDFADPEVASALQAQLDRLGALVGQVSNDVLAPQGLSVWQRAQRVLQNAEAWQNFQPWIDSHNPRLAFGVARGLVLGSMLTEQERSAAALMRAEARRRLRRLLPPGTIMCLPTTPFPAPLRGLALSQLPLPRDRISCLTAHGRLTRGPQAHLPLP